MLQKVEHSNNLSVLHNYFDETKFFSDLYFSKTILFVWNERNSSEETISEIFLNIKKFRIQRLAVQQIYIITIIDCYPSFS